MSKELEVQTDALSPAVNHRSMQEIEQEEIEELRKKYASLLEEAQWKAFHDARDLELVMDGGQLIIIDQSKTDAGIKNVVSAYLQKSSSLGGAPPTKITYQRLIGICGKAYWERLNEEIDFSTISLIATSQEARLREVALSDRQHASSDSQSLSYLRDRAVIRVLQELELPLDRAEENLALIHTLANKYLFYHSNTKKEVLWPRQATF